MKKINKKISNLAAHVIRFSDILEEEVTVVVPLNNNDVMSTLAQYVYIIY